MLSDWLDAQRDNDAGWTPVSTAALAGVTLFAAWCAWFAHTSERWVHVLDGANLAFHEAGHPIFGLLIPPLAVWGGTLGQLVFPAVATVAFARRRHTASAVCGGVWFGENLWNIARYMADARAQVLPLVGGGEHDWTHILGGAGLLDHDTTLAAVVRFVGWIVVLAALGFGTLRWHLDRDA
ncbi:MAG: hypothetical protein MUF30_05225 [Burkholderiales bacterium]|nr:hypothetical protein [Burkholderiales bacterium]